MAFHRTSSPGFFWNIYGFPKINSSLRTEIRHPLKQLDSLYSQPENGNRPNLWCLITSQKPSRPSPIRYRKQLSIATQMALGEQIRNMRDFAGYSLMAPGRQSTRARGSRFMSPQLLYNCLL